MWLLSVISTLVALTGAARAIAVSSPDVVEKLDEVPPGWAAVGVPDAEKRVNLRIAMTVVSLIPMLDAHHILAPWPQLGTSLKRDTGSTDFGA